MSGTDDPLLATPEDWRSALDAVRPSYLALAERVERLLDDLLDEAGLARWTTWHDALGSDALVERMWSRQRARLPLPYGLRDVPDLARVGVVTYTKRDVPAVCELVAQEFEVDHERSVDVRAADVLNSAPERAERTGYAFPSFVVALSDERRALPEWAPLAGLQVQVSVQTVLHAAWAAINDGRPFTTDAVRPASAQQALVRAALAFRDADAAMSDVWATYGAAEERAERALADGSLDLAVDSVSLVAYLLGSERVAAVAEVAERIGMTPDDVPDRVGYVEDHVWTLREAGISTLADLDDVLRRGEGRVEAILRDLHALTTEDDQPPMVATREDLVTVLVLILERLDAETIALSRWASRIESALNTLIGNAGPTAG